MSEVLRVFLDSNVLFSAVYRTPNRFERLWHLDSTEMLTCPYCISEVRRNLQSTSHEGRFLALLNRTTVVDDCDPKRMPQTLMLPAKDIPVMAAAVACKANILLTGDRNHFMRFYGQTYAGVLVESPDDFWLRFPDEI